MPTFRNDGSMPLNYASEGGPWVEPGCEFEHDAGTPLVVSHLASGFISEVTGGEAVESKWIFDQDGTSRDK